MLLKTRSISIAYVAILPKSVTNTKMKELEYRAGYYK